MLITEGSSYDVCGNKGKMLELPEPRSMEGEPPSAGAQVSEEGILFC